MYDPWAKPSPADLQPGQYAVPTPVSSEDYPSHVRPDGPPQAVPPDQDRRCDDESFDRFTQHFDEADLAWGPRGRTAARRWRYASTANGSHPARWRRSRYSTSCVVAPRSSS